MIDDSGETPVAEDDVKRVTVWTITQSKQEGKSNREIAENIPHSPAMDEHSDGQLGTFKLYRKYHQKL